MAAFRLVLVLLFAGVTASSVVDLQKRIIGGHACGTQDRLYHVLLRTGKGGFCGGSLIHKKWILTAAHCWNWKMNATFRVHTGSPKTVDIVAAPRIYEDGQYWAHDLMLLKLPDSVKLPAGVKPIALPDCKNPPGLESLIQNPDCANQLLLNSVVQIAGQGSATMYPNKTRQRGYTPVLQCADIPVVDCTSFYAKSYDHVFCGFDGNVDLCFGDSGGGVVYNNMLYGVNVRVGDSKNACTEEAIFMNICHDDYKKWIQKTINPKPGLLSLFGRG